MRYGFVIDQRKCIGCHACTVACKEENQVPLGVNRTWVKYIEKGVFPDTRRYFSVMRCNHCDNAPCVTICPTVALYRRPDGIVDFDGERCIGCKSCMQACPYDALYIDPRSNTPWFTTPYGGSTAQDFLNGSVLAPYKLAVANEGRTKSQIREWRVNAEKRGYVRLAELSSAFSDNVLDATQAWGKVLPDASRLGGLPESARALLAALAQQKLQSKPGPFGEDRVTERPPIRVADVGGPLQLERAERSDVPIHPDPAGIGPNVFRFHAGLDRARNTSSSIGRA